MIQLEIALSDKHFAYLQQLQQARGASLNQVVSELIEADIAWQSTLANDPITVIDDDMPPEKIDQLIYSL